MADPGEDPGRGGGVLVYRNVEDKHFEQVLGALSWEKNTAFGGLVLQGPCPVCGHDNAIDVFVPTDIAAFRAETPVSDEYVACRCSENHQQPAGLTGCGRWGFVRPHVAGQA